MSFEDLEVSLDSGQPIFLYEIVRQGRAWRYTNVNRSIIYEGNTYAGLPIVDGGVTQDGGADSTEFKMTLPASAAFCQYLDAVNTSFPLALYVRKVHLLQSISTPGDYDEPLSATAKLLWAGSLMSISRPAQNQRELVFSTLVSSVKRGGLRLTWGRSCPHQLYGRGCFVNVATYTHILSSVSVVNGITLSTPTVDALPDNFFSGGYVEWQWEFGLIERTAIESHVGSTLTLLGTTQGMQHALDLGLSPFKAVAGCDRTADTCHTKFNNILNFGGIEFLQGKSPFAGDPIF